VERLERARAARRRAPWEALPAEPALEAEADAANRAWWVSTYGVPKPADDATLAAWLTSAGPAVVRRPPR